MSEQEPLFEYDEEAAVNFIRNYLPQEMKDAFPEDTIYYLLDTICDFYEKNDYLDEDDREKEERELTDYMISQSREDEIGTFSREEMILFLKAEEAYTDTLDLPE